MAEANQPAGAPRRANSRFAAIMTVVLGRLKTLLPLAIATILMLLGFFLIWQCSLVYSESDSFEAAQAARKRAVSDIGAKIQQLNQQATEIVQSPVVLDALGSADPQGLAAAAEAVKAQWPEVVESTFYTAELPEVRGQDLKTFGYWRAQMLMQAQMGMAPAPAQVHGGPGNQQLLVLVQPVVSAGKPVAYASLSLPSRVIIDILGRVARGGARIDLRQGDGRGDTQIASSGNSHGSSIGDLGEPIAGSRLRLAIADPDNQILVTRNLWALVPVTLLCLLGGFVALWLRQVGMQGAANAFRPGKRSSTEEITLAQAIEQQAAAAVAAPVAPKHGKAEPSKPKLPERKVSINRSIFRAYDIRGVLGQTLTNDIARQIGRAIGSEAQERGLREIVVGRDGRLSGPDLSAALIDGLRAAGCDVIDIGLAATPLTYFAAYQLQTGSCVSVTGSHNPPDYNGFKIVLGGETLSEGAIQDLYGRIAEDRLSSGSGGLQVMSLNDDYINRITDDIQVETKLKVVIDCGNGVAGAIAPAVLAGIGCDVHELYCDVDGEFPNHHPDPSDPHNLQDLILSVKQTGADIGLAFDGDGDRLGVVTRTGEVIYPDRLLMLFAIDVLSRNPGATIIYDVKCTGHLQPLILQHGGSPIMWRTGHSLIKAKMRETGAQLAGEMSGHFFFAERWYGFDDAVYAAARLLEIVAGDPEGRSPEAIFASLPKGVSTPELKIELHEGEHYRFIEAFKAKANFEGARLTTIDGVRADWPDGWGLVRASNTTPVLVLRFDADSEIALKRIQAVFREQLQAVDRALALPF
ncbi:MAG: phosphomannomutase/phosphoglucomutase [Dokdonella sp.]|uniref:phosphomannomutase/phosphoglucomutase n=2 Tax=Dokdonella sp. TaxID=2291710 RepID=UPI002C6283E7|nr:phosphomannomutase/phosphoglucomutase [Dokdonella sp.]HOX72890.1 phosphomannomutase/phosphoglucomutase [Dokdonella sp.]HPG93833.1 phosphomannomutase/phosphoglucomutase [Dokdonella sp.]